MPCTRHRVFLATLIVAAKYLNDSAPKNKHWARYAILFDTAEINLMEQQLLYLLDFDLRFNEKQAIEYFSPFMPHRLTSPEQARETRKSAVRRINARRSRSYVDVRAQLPLTPPPEAPVAPSLEAPCKSSDGLLDVPISRSSSSSGSDGDSTMVSSTSTASSTPLSSPNSMSRCATAGSEASMSSLIEDNDSSGSEHEDSEEETLTNIVVPIEDCKNSVPFPTAKQSRVSFALPPKPPPVRPNTFRSSSYNVSSNQRRTHFNEPRSATQPGFNVAALPAYLPSIRGRVSSGFLSRMFGNGNKDGTGPGEQAQKLDAILRKGSKPHFGPDDVVIASASDVSMHLDDGTISSSRLDRSHSFQYENMA